MYRASSATTSRHRLTIIDDDKPNNVLVRIICVLFIVWHPFLLSHFFQSTYLYDWYNIIDPRWFHYTNRSWCHQYYASMYPTISLSCLVNHILMLIGYSWYNLCNWRILGCCAISSINHETISYISLWLHTRQVSCISHIIRTVSIFRS
jgi:hypothetical protein